MTPAAGSSLSQLLIDRLLASGEKIACRVVGRAGVVEEVTYGELSDRVHRLVSLLRGLDADRPILVMLPNGIDFAATFLAGILSGRTLVPLPYPEEKHTARLTRMVLSFQRDCESTHLVTDDSAHATLAGLLPPEVRVLTEGDASSERPVELEALSDSTVSHLQYTSGSTAQPRGALLTHRGLYHNVLAAQKAWGYSDRSITFSWVPLFNIFGLTSGLLVPLCSGATTILARPSEVAPDPLFWLHTMSRYRATHSGATNFGYQLCNSVLEGGIPEIDLTAWQVAICGGEAVREATAEAFVRLAGKVGFRRDAFVPAYGLTEYCGLAACKPRGESFRVGAPDGAKPGSRVVSLGRVVESGGARIVDPEGLDEVAEGAEGEIVLSGPCLFTGYWRRPEATEQSLVTLKDGNKGFRTGDLGFVRDGEVYLTGRLKELIVIKGEKLHPIDIELLAARVPGAAGADLVAFSIEGEREQEELIVLFEGGGPSDTGRDELASAIHRKITEEYGFAPKLVAAVPDGFIERTRTDKIQRLPTRDKFVRSRSVQQVAKWLALPEPRRRQAVEEYLEDRLIGLHAANARLEIDPGASFSDVGVDSATLDRLHRELSALFPDREVSSTVFFEYPTIERLAELVVGFLEDPE